MDVWVHRATPANGIASEKQKAPQAFDLVKLFLAVLAPDLDPVFLHQQRHQVAAIAPAVPLDAADLIEEAGQNARIRVSHACERKGFVPLHILCDHLKNLNNLQMQI